MVKFYCNLLFEGQGGSTQRSDVDGLVPWQCESGSLAKVRENSKNIVQGTSLLRMPSPQVTLQSPHASGLKL